MARGLENGTAIITGGATLIGRAVVRTFHEAGANVAIADIDADGGRTLAARARTRVLRGNRHPRRPADRAACGRNRRALRRDRLPRQPCLLLPRRGADLAPDGLARVAERKRRQRGDDGQRRASPHGRPAPRRDRQPHLDLGQGRTDRSLALSRGEGGPRAADKEHGDGLHRRRNPSQFGLARLDVVARHGRVDRRRSR